MITPILETPTPSGIMARTPGRGEGIRLFARTLVRVFGSDLAQWRVLDVGGGDGWLGEELPCRQYFCLDPSVREPSIHAVARYPLFRMSSHVMLWSEHISGRAERLPFDDASFDLVVSKQTLVHFEDPSRACREMLRVAKTAVVIRQEFPESPIGWPGHSRVTIDTPEDILACLRVPGWTATYDGQDFIARREETP